MANMAELPGAARAHQIFLGDVLALAGEEPDAVPREGATRDHCPWRKSLWGFAGNCRSGMNLTGHWSTTDDMIVDLIAGGLMLAFGVLVLLMWSFQR